MNKCLISNPFFNRDKKIINNKYSKLIDVESEDICNEFSKLYCICLNNNCNLDDGFYNSDFTFDKMKTYIESLKLIEGNIKMIYNKIHKSALVVIDTYILDLFNSQIEFNDEQVLVLPLININENQLKLYLLQFNGLFQMEDYINLKVINEFYQTPVISSQKILSNILDNSNCSNYWCDKNNCKLNITDKFLNRGFTQRMLGKDEAYLDFLLDKTNYTDIASSSFYKITEPKYLITIENINDIITQEYSYDIYKLYINLLISKDYCHLILNNKYAFYNQTNNFILALKYAFGYAWLSLSMEESIKKTKMTLNDRFVFNIDTASLLPFFPFTHTNYLDNPYISLLISDKVIDIENNNLGVSTYKKKYGIVSFNNFKKRLNIYMTGNLSDNIFVGINWNNFAICGSCIPACITLFNPLMEQFSTLDRYYQEYYTGDIDIMCNINDTFEYIDAVYELYNIIEKNYFNIMSDNNYGIHLESYNSCSMVIDEQFIHQNISIHTDHTMEYIIKNCNQDDIKVLFHDYYINYKLKLNETLMLSSKWTEPNYNIYFELVSIETFSVIYSNETKFECNENIKFKIITNKLLHEIEIFKLKSNKSFLSAVSQFHLPCVRGYYDGYNVKLLPSCITAAMTLYNCDYKYINNKKDPIEIINKYKMRGYTILLNNNEKMKLVNYSNNNSKWNSLYGNINIHDPENVNEIFKERIIEDNLFKPRLINENKYNNLKLVDFNYNQCKVDLEENNLAKSYEYHYTINYIDVKSIFELCNLKTINTDGFINPVQKWLFDLIYDTFELEHF